MSVFQAVRNTLWKLQQAGPSRMSPGQLRAVQTRRLRRLLRHAIDRSPFYRDRFRGIDADRCSLVDLRPVTKAELMADFDRVVTDPEVRRADLERFVDDPANVGRLFLDRYPVCHTSGSQGQPFLVVQNRLTLDLLFTFQMTRGNADFRRLGVFEAARRVVRKGRLAVLLSRQGFFPSAWAWQHLPADLRPYVEVRFLMRSDPDVVDQLNAFRPTHFAASPSALDTVAVHSDRLRLRPHLRQVVANSETLTAPVRARLEAAFGVPVLDTYACGECLFLTNGCPAGPGAHVNADWAILEVVDEHGRPVPPGRPGHKAFLTNLANPVQPLIRYEVGDRVTMAAGPCPCGSRLPKVERVDGRAADFFWVRAGAGYRQLTTYPFQHALEYVRELREWQAVQRERNRVVVRLEPLPGATLDPARAHDRLTERLESVGLRGIVEFSLEVVPQIAPDPRTGKLRRLVSEVGPPADLSRPA